MLALAAGFVLWVLSSFIGSPSRTTDTDSASIPSREERVAFVSRYVPTPAPILDASFHIVFHDNSQGLPGPSDFSIAVALRVSPSDRARWLADSQSGAGRHKSDAPPKQPWRAIPSAWGISSAGEVYLQPGAWLIWHPEGALEYSSTTF
jgi:hypothetical protein